jgi:hypothetical protein
VFCKIRLPKKKSAAGKKWLPTFLKGHTEKSMRTPEGISAIRVESFTLENVVKFFDNYEFELRRFDHPN